VIALGEHDQSIIREKGYLAIHPRPHSPTCGLNEPAIHLIQRVQKCAPLTPQLSDTDHYNRAATGDSERIWHRATLNALQPAEALQVGVGPKRLDFVRLRHVGGLRNAARLLRRARGRRLVAP
jgi:hypothetical protein